MKKRPLAPFSPPVTGFEKTKAKFEAAREAFFPVWKKLLDEAEGNISRAGQIAYARGEFLVGDDAETLSKAKLKQRIRNRALWMTMRFQLEVYAKQLRAASGQNALGRPRSGGLVK